MASTDNRLFLKGSMRLFLTGDRLYESTGKPMVLFSLGVALERAADEPDTTIFEIPGFRIFAGHVNYPARPYKNGTAYAKMLNVKDEEDLSKHIGALAKIYWAEKYPTVEFPKSDAN